MNFGGAVLRVQLRKMPSIIEHMRASKYRIRRALGALPGVKFRRVVDPAGDTGAFLIATYESPATAKQVNDALRAEGITTYPQGLSNIRMTDWGLHLGINFWDARLKGKPLTISELAEHYRQRELKPDTVWKTYFTKRTYEGYLSKCASLGKLPPYAHQRWRSRTVVAIPASCSR
jgi:hypothetical protein